MICQFVQGKILPGILPNSRPFQTMRPIRGDSFSDYIPSFLSPEIFNINLYYASKTNKIGLLSKETPFYLHSPVTISWLLRDT
jgi:hypothetical protein